MKDEDIDWLIYHLLVQAKTTTPEDLAARSGLDYSTVVTSLQRLEKNLLIEQVNGSARVISISESLIRCKVKYDANLPFTIENGVIKPKKKE